MLRQFHFLFYVFCVLLSCQAPFAADSTEEPNLQTDPSPSFKFTISDALTRATEDEAHQWALEDFCLCDEDKMTTWKETYAFYNAFWHYYENEKVLQNLADQAFPLAKIYQSFETDEFYFNSLDYISQKLGARTYDFLTNLTIVEIFKLIRDAVICQIKDCSTLISQSLLVEDAKEQFYKRPGINEGGRRIEALDDGGSKLLIAAYQQSYLYEKLLNACHEHIIARGNSSSILFLEFQSSLCRGTPVLKQLSLCEAAQNKYHTKQGHLHPGTFQHSFLVPEYEILASSTKNPFPSDSRIIDLSFNSMQVNEVPVVIQKCVELIRKGAHTWALALGYSFMSQNWDIENTPQFDPNFEMAKLWYTQALQYPTTQIKAQKALEDLQESIRSANLK